MGDVHVAGHRQLRDQLAQDGQAQELLVEAQVKQGMFFIDRHKCGQEAGFLVDVPSSSRLKT